METRFGIVGCGNVARFHVQGLEKAGAAIVHVADWDETAARSYAERLGCRCSTDYRELLKDPQVTALNILVNGKYHREICLAALEAGKDVICEKTMTDNAEEAEEVARAALRSGRLFFSAYMKRFFPAVRKGKELVPTLGRLFSAQVRIYQQWGNFYEGTDLGEFASVVQNYGGAVLKCAGSHIIDLVLHLLGRPTHLYAHIDYVDETDFDRKVVAVLEYPDGLTVGFEAAAHPLKKIGYERNSWEEWIEISGTDGRLRLCTPRWDAPDRNPALLFHYDNRNDTAVEYRFDPVNPFDEEMRYFYECLKNREQGRPNVLDGFDVDVLIDAMGRSTRQQRRIAIDYRSLQNRPAK